MFNKTISNLYERVKSYSSYLVIFLIILLGFSLTRNVFKFLEVRKQIADTQKRIESLKAENEEIKRRLAQTQSQAFIEEQLRDKLGLAKKGEIVVVLPDVEVLKKLTPDLPEEEDFLPDPTWKKWLKLFF